MEFGVKVPMRDGVKLSANIYRPDAEEKFPVILTRSPYSSIEMEGIQKEIVASGKYFAERGYVYVFQDCRGKNDSEGMWYPLINEAEDGYDTQEWCATNPWSNGNVGTIGGSYGAWNQWLAAVLGNKHLKTMVSMVAPPDPFHNVPYWNGAFCLQMAVWAVIVDGKKNQSLQPYGDLNKILCHLPLLTMDEAFGRKIAWWKDWITHSSYDEYWKKVSYQDKFKRINVPVLHITGWYDDDAIGSHMNFIGMQREGGTELARKNQRLIVGPWPHAVNRSKKIADIYFGPQAVIDLQNTILQWFDHWLKGRDIGIIKKPPVYMFIMGANKWRREREWPLARTKHTKYYFHSGGRANSLYGDGTLNINPPGREPPDRFTYNPEKPVPLIAPRFFDPKMPEQPSGAEDQTPVERRDDVIVYTSEVLRRNLEITGAVKIKLYAASSARDTDFTGKLVDVFPNQYAMKIWEGILRARFRESYEKPTLIEPNKIYDFTIDLWYTSNVFRKSHRIRVEISSSNFPQFDRNPNTGNPIGTDTEVKTAQQTIYHDEEHPSYILLPITPRR